LQTEEKDGEGERVEPGQDEQPSHSLEMLANGEAHIDESLYSNQHIRLLFCQKINSSQVLFGTKRPGCVRRCRCVNAIVIEKKLKLMID